MLDEFPGHDEPVREDAKSLYEEYENEASDLYITEDPNVIPHIRIDKSNLLLLGPTGVGKTYILE